uniref:Uncharacterized protein n=1 Tax=Phlebotomus papatasi TaxID=29031 RepID=A0A1B0DKZ8_PHLPP
MEIADMKKKIAQQLKLLIASDKADVSDKSEEKDRKRANEMKRMADMHNKQSEGCPYFKSNVLKRKFEECVAKAKRLEETLGRQKAVQSMRKGNMSKQDGEQLITWLDHEIEVMISTIDAKVLLDHLMEDRGMATVRLNETKALLMLNPDEVIELEEDLEMRNAQIIHLQQKTMKFNMTSKAKTIPDGFGTLQDAKMGWH